MEDPGEASGGLAQLILDEFALGDVDEGDDIQGSPSTSMVSAE